ncbi:MAG: prephenate dehydrogenase/arogenate dehydrogenase family protein [Candidatus Baldrarchaeia archaeon]
MRLGIVGYGRMGRWFAEKLKDHFEIGVYDIDPSKVKDFWGVVYSTLEDLVVNSDVILIATPIDVTSEVLEDVREIVQRRGLRGKIIIDIASLKGSIIPVLKKFPKSVKVCSVHPLFGRTADSFKSRKIVVVPVDGRCEDCKFVIDLFSLLGADIVIADPEFHDRTVAVTIALPYFIGLLYGYFVCREGVRKLEKFAGPSFKRLISHTREILDDSDELVFSLLNSRHSRVAIRKFLNFACQLLDAVKNIHELSSLLKNLRENLSRSR